MFQLNLIIEVLSSSIIFQNQIKLNRNIDTDEMGSLFSCNSHKDKKKEREPKPKNSKRTKMTFQIFQACFPKCIVTEDRFEKQIIGLCTHHLGFSLFLSSSHHHHHHPH
jgi:hypothetical protein